MFRKLLAIAACALATASSVSADNSFADLVGPVSVGEVSNRGPLNVGYIVWGGDFASFHANGGLQTQRNSIWDKQGLDVNLRPGDDFPQQVRDYMEGKTPILRGTYRMIGMASEVINSDPRTRPVLLMQMTWSKGDHMVARSSVVQSISDLRGKRIAIQQGGPHVGMLYDILDSAGLDYNDVEVVWKDNLTGSGSPAEAFRNDNSIAACFVITPDMIGLTGGLQNTGNGREGTVRGALVKVSTNELSRSIADVWVARSDWFEQNRDTAHKLVAGYLKGAEEILELKQAWETKGSRQYENLLEMAQKIYGTDVLPTLEEDAHGLLSDCAFVGHPGNVKFFSQNSATSNNIFGFNSRSTSMIREWGYARNPGTQVAIQPAAIDWNSSAFVGYLSSVGATNNTQFDQREIVAEITSITDEGGLDDRTIYSFSISFDPNQREFPASQYSNEYNKIVELLDKYAGAVVVVRGHSDPSLTLRTFVQAAMQEGSLKRSGTRGNYRYSLGGRPLDIGQTQKLVTLIEQGRFDREVNVGQQSATPREVMRSAMTLSHARATEVLAQIEAYARSQGVQISNGQITPLGVGIREPFIPVPQSMNEARDNMRVEIRLMRVEAEAVSDSIFDF